MDTTKLSSKGQVIIPKYIRDLRNWSAGLELEVIALGEGILLKPKAIFPHTTLEDVAGCLNYRGKAKSDDDIEAAMKKAAVEAWSGRG
ncbi:MAG: AbrB/MazE/SpoVT family DNA-binding domain-containing protein [Hahellaceae bacterium]|nr:AbrB/MazE/SpoVT family DNA-binding domain-containing protein [Hahellaceae bacterium]